mmetsp:Transcript_33284/g.38548  ORF Transcript_33284/g.38548 Transcript_33284/m.38548 type:complete len:90 (+) Transcript_33284:375-644(+)
MNIGIVWNFFLKTMSGSFYERSKNLTSRRAIITDNHIMYGIIATTKNTSRSTAMNSLVGRDRSDDDPPPHTVVRLCTTIQPEIVQYGER